MRRGCADDEREFRNIKRSEEDTTKDLGIYTKQFRAYEAKKLASNPKPASNKRGARGSWGGRNYPSRLPSFSDESLWQDVGAINALLPPNDTKVYKDIPGRRFQLFWVKSRVTRSSAWLRYGYAGAIKRTLRLVWQEWGRLGGDPPPFELPA